MNNARKGGMRSCLILMITLSACYGHAGAGITDVALAPLWSVSQLKTPASVLVIGEGSEGFLLVSQIDGGANDKDGKGGIAKIGLDGTVISRDWVSGLHAPKGMATVAGKLMVTDIDQVVVIDLATAEVESRIALAGAKALHDIAVTDAGTLYVSDPVTGTIHRLENNRATVLVEGMFGATAMATVADTLFIAHDDSIWQIGVDGRKTTVAMDLAGSVAGLLTLGSGEFIASSSAGFIYIVEHPFATVVETTDVDNAATDRIRLILDTQGEKRAADIGWHDDEHTLYVPTLDAGTLDAYALTTEPVAPATGGR